MNVNKASEVHAWDSGDNRIERIIIDKTHKKRRHRQLGLPSQAEDGPFGNVLKFCILR